ncbi:MAG: NAD(P)-dependent oxidoreductase [Bacteroidetes bacterium]|nr:NAD(P)-dependent oxidoreductase [Bacteroidota bacterium]
MSKIAFLGLGAMGSRMAANLLKAGHAVTVWNRDTEKTKPLVAQGAVAADTPRAASTGSEYVISIVRDDDASREVWLDDSTGALGGMSSKALAIESSTLTVAWAKELAGHCVKKSIRFLDAPVAGSRLQAEAAQLIFLVGGEAADVEKVRPILLNMGGAVHHAGQAGHGASVKLMVNALFGVQLAAFAELLGMMRNLGVNETTAVNIVSAIPVCSPAVKNAAGSMLKRAFAPMFTIDLTEKDFRYIVETADANNAPVPVSQSALGVFRKAIEEGYAEDNVTGVAQLYL